MPKKPNRVDLQEYVPAGNGDASGEYADEQGGNKHFASFKRPEDPLPGEDLSKGKTQGIETPTAPSETEKPKETDEETLRKAKDKLKDAYEHTGLGKRMKKQIAEAIENEAYPYTKEKILESYQNILNNEMEQQKKKEDDSKKPFVYYRKNGSWYITRHPENLDPSVKTYNEEEKNAWDKAKTEAKGKPKSKTDAHREKMEQDWKTKSGYQGVVNFEGFTEKKVKECLDAFDSVSNDFPFIKTTLETFGTNTGIVSASYRELAKVKASKEYPQLLAERRKELERLNPNETFTDDYVKRSFEGLFLASNKFRKAEGSYWGVTYGTTRIRIKNTNYQKLIDRGYDKHVPPYNATLSLFGTTAHELGHVVSNTLFGKGPLGHFPTMPKDIQEVWLQKRDAVSVYGKQDLAEFISECVASHYSKQNNPTAEKVFGMLVKHAKDRETRSGIYAY